MDEQSTYGGAWFGPDRERSRRRRIREMAARQEVEEREMELDRCGGFVDSDKEGAQCESDCPPKQEEPGF